MSHREPIRFSFKSDGVESKSRNDLLTKDLSAVYDSIFESLHHEITATIETIRIRS